MQSRQMLAQACFPAQASGNVKGNESFQPENFEVYLQRFKNLYPHLYETWASINFGVNVQEFKEHPEQSVATDNRENARLFKGFAAPYLHGRVLDVGCGPYAVPNYLDGYPVDLISGIDPLEPFEAHPFEFVRGFGEFLPWGEACFDVAIAATSLDHTLSLELALAEIRRVLKPGGFLLVWDWFSPQSRPYHPEEQSPQLIDRYHLFNLSEDWFEEMMAPQFSIFEKIRLSGFWQYDRFYALKRLVK
jgi:SAM-dependent methyltransferase